MNLYLLWQEVNNDYDTYDSCVVCAESISEAIQIHPANFQGFDTIKVDDERSSSEWAAQENIYCRLLGKADPSVPKGLVLASFNAG